MLNGILRKRKMGDLVVAAVCGVIVFMYASIGYAEINASDPRLMPEIAKDSRLSAGVNDKACVFRSVPSRFSKGVRTPFGAYCLEEGDTPNRVKALPTDRDFHDPNTGEEGRKLTLQELLQIMLTAHLVQQLDILEKVRTSLGSLDEAIRKDLKAWQKESMDNVTTRLESLPTSVASNADIINAVKEAAMGQLATDPAFISAVKAALADKK